MAEFWKKIQETLDEGMVVLKENVELAKKGLKVIIVKTREGAVAGVEKAKESARLTKIRLDLANLQREAGMAFAELGARVYELKGKKKDIWKDKKLGNLIKKIKKYETETAKMEKKLKSR